MYALGVTCPTSPLLNLDILIFAEFIQKQEAVRHQIHLEIEKMAFGWQQNI